MDFRKSLTEADIVAYIESGQLRFPPLSVSQVQTDVPEPIGDRSARLDALITFRWGEREYGFAVECRRLWTPKAIAEAAVQARRNSSPPRLYPLILVPYLPQPRLAQLEEEGMSGLDLCGNGILTVPNELLVYRTGNPNRFPRAGSIKNVYRRNSSIVARVFLLKPEFESVSKVLKEVESRGGQVTLATVSKVCGSLDSDLIIERRRNEASAGRRLRLLQPDKLLDLLEENYSPPELTRTFTGKSILSPAELREALEKWQAATTERVTMTGECSVEAYAVMARDSAQVFYCSNVASAREWLGARVSEGPRFANVNLLETRDEFVYFDRRPGLVASPIQTYLELATGDKRDRETADQVRRSILGPLTDLSRANGTIDNQSPRPSL